MTFSQRLARGVLWLCGWKLLDLVERPKKAVVVAYPHTSNWDFPWAVLGLTCLIELFTQVHYRSSIDGDDAIDPLWKDVFLFHWREESQHAILDELEALPSIVVSAPALSGAWSRNFPGTMNFSSLSLPKVRASSLKAGSPASTVSP